MIKVTWLRNEEWIVTLTEQDGEVLSKFASEKGQTRDQVINEAVTVGLNELYNRTKGGD